MADTLFTIADDIVSVQSCIYGTILLSFPLGTKPSQLIFPAYGHIIDLQCIPFYKTSLPLVSLHDQSSTIHDISDSESIDQKTVAVRYSQSHSPVADGSDWPYGVGLCWLSYRSKVSGPNALEVFRLILDWEVPDTIHGPEIPQWRGLEKWHIQMTELPNLQVGQHERV